MGLLNTFICIPQILEMVTIGSYYDSLLKGDPRNAIALAGICLILGAIACLFISKEAETQVTTIEVIAAEAGETEAEARS
jgi:maltose/moltooligosaccharide transporter